MKHNVLGTTIVEFLCYFFLTILLGIVVSHLAVMTHRQLGKHTNHLSAELSLYAALDVVRRDFLAAPSDLQAFKKITPSELIWDTGTAHLGWQFENNTLFRLEGVYHNQRQTWTKKTKNVIAKNIQLAKFHIHDERGVIQYFEILLQHADHARSKKACITARNREIS